MMSKTLIFTVVYHVFFLSLAFSSLNFGFNNFIFAISCFLLLLIGYLILDRLCGDCPRATKILCLGTSRSDELFLRFSNLAFGGVFLFSIYVMLKIDDLSTYRMLAFGSEDRPSILYGSQLTALVVNQLIYIISYMNLSIGVRMTMVTGRVLYFIKFSIPLILSGLIMFDRGWVYVLIVSYIYILLNTLSRIGGKLIIQLSSVFFVALLVTLMLSFLRGDNFSDVFDYIININLIGYNIIGYQLMEEYLTYLMFNYPEGFGTYTFGGLENFLYLVSRLFGLRLDIHGARLVEFFQLSHSTWHDVDYNAFYTIFTPLLLDFGYIGGLLFFIVLGAVYKLVSIPSSAPVVQLKFLIFLLFVSFNQKPLMSSIGYSILVIFLLAQSFYYKVKTKI